MTKALIVNADDFGLTSSINSGIIRAFKEGVVKSTSLMATGRAFNDAVKLTRIYPDLDIGLHLTLTNEKPILIPDYIKSLVDKNGNFFPLSIFLLRYFIRKIRKEEIKLELRAQFEKAIDSDPKITHIDSHNHIHILPCILDITIKLCKEFNIKYIRYPSEKIALKHIFSGFFKRTLLMCIVKILLINAGDKIKKAGLNSTQFFFGFFNSGNLKMGDIEKIIFSFKNGLSELMVHPGEVDNELLTKYSHWNYNWQQEFNLLTQENVKILLKRKLVKQTNFGEIINGQ